MKLFNLEGKTALVTGGNGGIGLGMARGLAGAGAAQLSLDWQRPRRLTCIKRTLSPWG